jgi:hypothetical protein
VLFAIADQLDMVSLRVLIDALEEPAVRDAVRHAVCARLAAQNHAFVHAVERRMLPLTADTIKTLPWHVKDALLDAHRGVMRRPAMAKNHDETHRDATWVYAVDIHGANSMLATYLRLLSPPFVHQAAQEQRTFEQLNMASMWWHLVMCPLFSVGRLFWSNAVASRCLCRITAAVRRARSCFLRHELKQEYHCLNRAVTHAAMFGV